MTDLSSCLNCGHVLPPPGCFCPQCGQAPAHRLSTAHVLHTFTHADKGFFAFIPQILLRPGQLVADYLAGRRKRRFSPFQFLLLVGLATLLSKQLHYYDAVGDYVQDLLRARHVPPFLLVRAASYFHGLGTYFNVWWLTMLPLHALVTWTVYGWRPTRLNYAESLLVQVVVGCAFQLGLMGRFPGASTAYMQGAVAVGYLVLVGRQGLGWGGATWRALVTGVLAGAINYCVNSAAFGRYVFGLVLLVLSQRN